MQKQKVTIFHNTSCSKSKCALEMLEKSNVEIEVIDYLKATPSINDLEQLLAKLNMKPFDIIRQDEPLFKKKFQGLNFNDHEWLRVMVENPILIQRPIVVKGYKAIIARPVELINDLL